MGYIVSKVQVSTFYAAVFPAIKRQLGDDFFLKFRTA
jgi:hypothetical protein